jgi:hypothetical protein
MSPGEKKPAAPKPSRRRAKPTKAGVPCDCDICRSLTALNVESLDMLASVFERRTLALVNCKERSTGEKVVVLGEVVEGLGFLPLARLFKDKAAYEVEPPDGCLDPLTAHPSRGQA